MSHRPVAILFLLTSLCSFAQTKVTFTPQWTPQSQFAGFYMAKEKGFYADEGLDVEIRHLGINSTESVLTQLLKGNAQIVGMQLLQSIVARSDGSPIVNVMQLSQKGALCCVSHNPISSPEDLNGMKIGKWRVGFSEICDIVQLSSNLDIQWVPFINGTGLFVFGAVDATLCYSYSELIALRFAIGEIQDDHILRFSDFGYDYPEDGLYVTEAYYAENKETVDKFVKASKRGWDYVRNNVDEALELTGRYLKDANVVTNKATQRLMLEEILRLQVNPLSGMADYSPVDIGTFKKMVDALLKSGNILSSVEYKEFVK